MSTSLNSVHIVVEQWDIEIHVILWMYQKLSVKFVKVFEIESYASTPKH